MKKIAVTMRIVEAQNYIEPRDALSHDWFKYFDVLGCVPVLISNQCKDPVGYAKDMGCSALFLTNGENVALQKDADGQWTGSIRDVAESKLMDWAIHENIPVVAICRGMQFINVYFGGTLSSGLEGHVTAVQELDVIDGGFKEFYKSEKIQRNSYHCMGMKLDQLGEGLVPWVMHEDVVEGVVHQSYPILGIQWHPEREDPFKEEDRKLLSGFLSGEMNMCCNNKERVK